MIMVRIVDLAICKNVVVKSTMSQHRNIHKYTWTSNNEKIVNHVDHILIERRWYSSILNLDPVRRLIMIL
jgi:hypothetical protein